jgi:hypothetical protein
MNELPKRFNYKNYILLNTDLQDFNEENAINHYKNYGYYENRKYSLIPDDFNYKDYLSLNPDLDNVSEEIAMDHYENYGYYENRKYKKITGIDNDNKDNEMIGCELINFLTFHNLTLDEYKTNVKVQFRFICYKYLNYIRCFSLPDFVETSDFEAVCIEYRKLPHMEFLIRNNIIKLGNKWSHTIICGNLNYEYITDLCNSISRKIKVIKTNYNNLMPSEYSKFLTTIEFWNLLKGKKIIIYQEDSLIFKNNIDDFLYFDYIGAPWMQDKNDNKTGVGNGGFSLRTKEIMVKIINTISIEDTIFNTNTIEYMKNTKSFFPPEDVYFTKNMEQYNIGILADRYHAMKFSTESVNYHDSLGGHTFWYSDPKWCDRMYKFNIVKFIPHYDLSILEHRGGWGSIIKRMKDCSFFSEDQNESQQSKFHFFDMIESEFLWKKDYVCETKWAGIIHCTPNCPPYLDVINIENLFNNPNFIKSLENCVFIISLSKTLTNYLIKKIKCELNMIIPVYTLYHPVISENIPMFNMNTFIYNENKILIQIGQQLRKMTSIYLLNTLHCNKLWLTGTKNFERINSLLESEIQYLNIDKSKMNKNISMHYTETYEEYDELLTKNLVFVDLFDASANNTILECIVRNTPIIVNKIDGVVEYLGDNYPLYFNTLDDVPGLIDTIKIQEAHIYLKKMDKSKFKIDYFVNKIFDLVNEHFLKFN